MKYRIFILMALLLFGSLGVSHSTTGNDRSSIIIKYQSFGWKGINAGWDEDEWLISPNHTLDYELHSTNRLLYPSATNQWVVTPEFNENWGEQVNNQWTANDNVIPQDPSATEKGGELREAWITWDTNWLYVGIVGHMKNSWSTGNGTQGDNILALFDFRPGFGYTAFPSQATWNKKVYTRDFDVDMYVGAYGGYGATPHEALCGFQWRFVNSLMDDDSIGSKYDLDGGGNPNPTTPDLTKLMAYYNGADEFDPTKRVFLFRLSMPFLLQNLISPTVIGLSNLNNVYMRVAFLTVDGNSGNSGEAYDSMPNNLAGMSSDNNSVLDNYFIIPFTDGSGNLLTGIRPRYDAQIRFLPGSLEYIPPQLSIIATASNTISSTVYPRSTFVPEMSEVINLKLSLKAKNNVFGGSIKIYNLRGELISTTSEVDPIEPITVNNNVTNTNYTTVLNWFADPNADTVLTSSWDGRNSSGELVPMGTYIVVFTGVTENGLAWNAKMYVTVIR